MRKIILLAVCVAILSHPAMAGEGTFLLYRNSILDASMRIYIAAFNAEEGAEYNSENCWVAADLFKNQDGVKTRFWCEPAEKED